MPNARIMIVEDERIVARKIQKSLEKLGYDVCAQVPTGEEAVQKAGETRPDLILMDIVLKGTMDGIEAAEQIRRLFNMPVVYLTAYANEKVFQRAKITEPYGYILKPFEDKELYIAIEIALHRNQSDARIRKVEYWLSNVLKSIGDAVIATDRERRITFMNHIAENLTGWKGDEALGKTVSAVLNIKDEEPEVMEGHLTEKVIVQGQIINLVEYRLLVAKNGTVIPISDSVAPIIDDRGETTGAVFVFRDITERRQICMENQQLAERLHRAEKMEALGTLAGGIAHDLNNVLGVLVGYSELLLEKIPKEHVCRRYAANILKSSERAASVIQDLLTLTRRGVTISQTININDVVGEFFKTPEFEKLKTYSPQVAFKADLATGLLNIKGSPVHLEKTLMNLLMNAAEAISDWGEVIIRTENCYIDKPIRGYDEVQEGDYVVLSVSDNGSGIPRSDFDKIFEPFYTKKVMGRSGTGLGLAVVWGTVKDHKGYLDVQSKEGKGSTFTLYLPATRGELIQNRQETPLEQYMGRGESVLVVDDVAEQREVAASMLVRLGYQVQAVSGGDEAVAYLRNNKADIMVLDMIMDRGMDGLETYQRILEINPQQRTVIVSGFSETDRVRKAQELGAGIYVRKPYVLEKIGVAIRDELAKGRMGVPAQSSLITGK